MIDRYEELIKRVLMGDLKEDGGEGAATTPTMPDGAAPQKANAARVSVLR